MEPLARNIEEAIEGKEYRNILSVAGIEDANASALERTVELAENNQARLAVVCVMISGKGHADVMAKDLPSRIPRGFATPATLVD